MAGKLSFSTAQLFGKKGTALPGKVALTLKPDLLEELSKKCDKIVFVTGTNGKTTTNNLSTHIFKGAYNDVLSNLNGSNMIQGVLTPFITDSKEHYDIGIFEVDEGSVPVVSEFMEPDYFIITNFFRDQLDRYGEVENTIKLVHDAICPKTTLIINTDEPSLLRFDDLPNKKVFYGLNKTQFAKDDISVAESIFCPNCGNRFTYDYVNYGNIGKFHCEKCGTKNHDADYFLESVDLDDGSYKFTVKHNGEDKDYVLNLRGLYNLYNTLGVITLCSELGIDYEIIKDRIENFEYRLGRMETFHFSKKDLILVLSKNPVGLSEVFSTITYDDAPKSMMFIINDYEPDGVDVSWLWDANFEEIKNVKNLKNFYCVGTRAEDLALRVKYAGIDESIIKIFPAKDQFDINQAVDELSNEDIKSYLIASFTAMPEARKILLKKEKEGF